MQAAAASPAAAPGKPLEDSWEKCHVTVCVAQIGAAISFLTCNGMLLITCTYIYSNRSDCSEWNQMMSYGSGTHFGDVVLLTQLPLHKEHL